MRRFVAFLGGINVGGHRVTGDQLVDAFAQPGHREVATFLASGNVVFSADGDPAALSARIEEHLGEALGYAVPTFLRSDQRVRHIAGHAPFPAAQVDASRGKLQVALLADTPDASAAVDIAALSSDDDRLALDGSELYWLPSGGITDSALDLAAVAAIVGRSTMRTANTVRRIAKKFFADA